LRKDKSTQTRQAYLDKKKSSRNKDKLKDGALNWAESEFLNREGQQIINRVIEKLRKAEISKDLYFINTII
jgi:hypothetical protein